MEADRPCASRTVRGARGRGLAFRTSLLIGGIYMELATYELKYCERCGSLGLRRSQSTGTYCEPCGRILLNYSLARDPARPVPRRRPASKQPVPLELKGEAAPSLPFGRLQ